MTATATMIDAALELARLGYHVHALRRGSKKPATAHGSDDATTDSDEIRRQFNRPRLNIGIGLRQSGLFIIGPDCAEWLEEFERRGLPDTMTAQSGSGPDHRHYYYRLPDGGPVHRDCVSQEYDNISNGYAIAPPSVTTGPYTFLTPLRAVEDLPYAPAWAVEMLQAAKDKEDAKPDPVPLPARPLVASDQEIIERARNAKNGAKFERLFNGDLSAHDGRDRSHSGADLALLSMFTFYTQDEAQLDRLFATSGIYRPDHWRGTYRTATLAKALQRTEFYEPPAPSGVTLIPNGRVIAGDVAAGGNAEDPPEPHTLTDVVDTFQRWLHLPDVTSIYVVVGAVVANEFEADPFWLMMVGPPGCGKTEHLNSLNGLPGVHHAATVTEAGLLSGTPKKETSNGASGGLLRLIGEHGTLICKDFTSVLSMNRDARAGVLAALREVYDGSWTRHLGTDGGRTLHWSGKLGLIAGVTPAIDSAHAVTGSMGERFVQFRFTTTEKQSSRQAARAMQNIGAEAALRRDLSDAMRGLLEHLDIPERPPALSPDLQARIVALASLVARCRSAVERENYGREIAQIPEPESPGRLARQLALLYGGMIVAGVDDRTAWKALLRVGLDSMPAIRRTALEMLTTGERRKTSEIAEEMGYPTTTTRRALEELTAHHVVMRYAGGEGKADEWKLAQWATDQWQAVTVPVLSEEEKIPLKFSDNSLEDKTGTVATGQQFCACGRLIATAELRAIGKCWKCAEQEVTR